MLQNQWILNFKKEIDDAMASQQKYPGRARVCARRAAGIIIKEYYRRKNTPLSTKSALASIQTLEKDKNAPAKAREICTHLLLRVDKDFALPYQGNLIDETLELAQILLDFDFKKVAPK